MHEPRPFFKDLLNQCVVVPVALYPELVDWLRVSGVVRIGGERAGYLVSWHEELIKNGAYLGSHKGYEGV